MTAAAAEPGDYYQQWSVRGCTFEVAYRTPCGSQDTVTVDGIVGRRCAEHPSLFDPDRAVALMVAGLTSTALSYCRWAA